METNTNTYRLNQGNKDYILTTSIIGNQLKMACHNSSDAANKKYIKLFTLEQLNQMHQIFSSLKTLFQASAFIDKALSNQKVGLTEESGILKITFYIIVNGMTNQIDIPLDEDYSSSYLASNGNQFAQKGSIQNYDMNHYIGASNGQNDIESLLNSAFSQSRQEVILDSKDANQYFGQTDSYNIENMNRNIYESNNANDFNYNQFIQSSDNNANNNNVGFVDDNSNQLYQEYNMNNVSKRQNNDYNYSYESNQFLQSFQNNENKTVDNQYVNPLETKPYITPTENIENNNANDNNIDEQIKQFLQIKDINANEGQNENDDLKALSMTKVLPVQTTSRVLPPIGPFTSLEGLDLYNLTNINAQKNNNIEYQQVQNGESQNYQNIQNELNVESQPILTTGQMAENSYTTINKITTNITNKKQFSGKKEKTKEESEEIRNLRSQLAELEPLRKKVSEMEVLRGQLTELNALRAQVAEYNAIKVQFQNANAKINQLALENQKLKERVEELEDIKQKYEEELKTLKENERLYSMKSRVTNTEEDREEKEEKDEKDEKDEKEEKEEKDIIYEENSQEGAVKGDIIHDTSELELLTRKINKLNQKLTLNLLYKATADSDRAAAFHAKCDEASSSIVLVETDKGKRFGGYTTCSWSGDCIDKPDEEAFVFSFDKMKTYDNIPGEDAVGCYPKFGPIFLGCQIRIYDKAFTKGGTTFERGLNFDTDEDYELTGGERCFKVKEIEVYEVIKE